MCIISVLQVVQQNNGCLSVYADDVVPDDAPATNLDVFNWVTILHFIKMSLRQEE